MHYTCFPKDLGNFPVNRCKHTLTKIFNVRQKYVGEKKKTLANHVSSHLQPPGTHTHKPATTRKALKAPASHRGTPTNIYIFRLSTPAIYTEPRETKRTRGSFPGRFMYLLTICEPHPSHTESVIASASCHSAVETSAMHRKSI